MGWDQGAKGDLGSYRALQQRLPQQPGASGLEGGMGVGVSASGVEVLGTPSQGPPSHWASVGGSGQCLTWCFSVERSQAVLSLVFLSGKMSGVVLNLIFLSGRPLGHA